MELERDVLVSPITEVPVVEGELVLAIRALADCGVGSKAIARAVGVARNTVRRYLRQSIDVEGQVRLAARRLTDDRRLEARTRYDGPAGGNAVVVQRLLAERGLTDALTTRAVSALRDRRTEGECSLARLASLRRQTMAMCDACRRFATFAWPPATHSDRSRYFSTSRSRRIDPSTALAGPHRPHC